MINIKRNIEFNIIMISVFILALLFNNIFINSLLAVIMFFIILLRLINKSIKELAYFEIIYFICLVQMVILPLFNSDGIKDIKQYFMIVLPGVFTFILGTNIIKRKKVEINTTLYKNFFQIKKNRNIALFFILLGIIGTIIPSLTKNSAMNLISNLSGIGIAMSFGLMYYNKKKYCFFPLIFFMIILFQSIISAVFASVIAYGLIIFIYIPTVFNLNKKQLVIFMMSGILIITLFQNVKLAYRQMVWKGGTKNFSVGLFINALYTPAEGDDMDMSERASAGNTISLIYDYVPNNYPHLYGENLKKDLANALLPRFLFPNKKPIDNSLNYIRYTGIPLSKGTSVGINIFGISYAEFGIIGSWIFLFLFGFFLNRVNNYLVNISLKNKNWFPFLLLLPIIYSNLFKFEQEFVGQFVGFIRNIILFYFLFKILDLLKLNFKI